MSQAATREETSRSEKRREELVRAAFNQIAEHGFEGLRTREVAAEVGVNIATLHYYFPTKESLIGGVLEYAMGRFRTTLEPHGSPSDQLRNHLRAVRKLMVGEPELAAVMGELTLRSSRDPAVRAIVDGMFASWQSTMRGLLRRAVKNGRLPARQDSDAVAGLVIAAIMGSTLPQVDPKRGDQAIRQLERLLGI